MILKISSPVILADTSAKDNIEFTNVTVLLFILLVILFKCMYP